MYQDMRAGFSRRELLGYSVAAGAAMIGGPLAAAAVEPDWPALDAMARSYVAERKVANMIACVGTGDAPPQLFAHGADRFGGPRKSGGDSLYRIYSMTKPITGMAAMMLVDEGLLRLDQPLAEILPKFAAMQAQKVYDGPIAPDNLEPAARPITIRQMLTHTAGLGYSAVQQGPISEAMRDRGVVSGRVSGIYPEFSRGTPVNSLEAFADGLAEMPLVYQPGTRWSYSTGLDLMGRVIEVVSGQSFDAFLKERIFDPCGMTSTFFTVPQTELGRMTDNYGMVDGRLVAIDPGATTIYADPAPFPMGGSGLVSSPRDYDRFLMMLAGFGRIEGRRVIGELAVRVGTANLLDDFSPLEGTSVAGYGYGAGGRVGWAGSKTAFGWTGAANTMGNVDMASGLRCSLFTQLAGGGPNSSVYSDLEEALAKDRALNQV